MTSRQEISAGVVPRQVIEFIQDLTPESVPFAVRRQAALFLLDTLGTAACGTRSEVSRILYAYVLDQMGGADTSARLPFDGRRASRTGVAMATGFSIDSIDSHDGHRLTKGHAGAGVVPALLAFADGDDAVDAAEFLSRTIVGYEVALRAGIAMHTLTDSYPSSGSWNALGAAAIAARSMGLDGPTLSHALGIAEYHGPRSPILRCTLHPSMLKDGSGWGAMVGTSAALLARRGFDSIVPETVTSERIRHLWDDLGSTWRLTEQYIKPYPVCRWAQPAVTGALAIVREHGLASTDIERLVVASFAEAGTLQTRYPASSDVAQYSLPYSVAVALARGELGPAEVLEEDLFVDPEVRRLCDAYEFVESAEFSDRFPRERWADVRIVTRSGDVFDSGPVTAPGDPENPLSDVEIEAKFHRFATAALDAGTARELAAAVLGLERGDSTPAELLDIVCGAPSQTDTAAA